MATNVSGSVNFVPRHEVGELRNAAVRLSVCPSVCPSVHHTLVVNTIFRKLLDGFRRNLVGGLGMVQGSCH